MVGSQKPRCFWISSSAILRLFPARTTSGRTVSAFEISVDSSGTAGIGCSGVVATMAPSRSRSARSRLSAFSRFCSATASSRCAALMAVSARSTSTFVTSPASKNALACVRRFSARSMLRFSMLMRASALISAR